MNPRPCWSRSLGSLHPSAALLALALLSLGCSEASSASNTNGAGGAPSGSGGGAGACAAGELLCDGQCTNVTADTLHCGACVTVCSAGQACNNGVCAVGVGGATSTGGQTGTGGGPFAATGGVSAVSTGGDSSTGGTDSIATGGAGSLATGGSGGSDLAASGGTDLTATGGASTLATGGSDPTVTGGSGGGATGGSGGAATGGSGGGATGGSGGGATGGSGGAANGGSGGSPPLEPFSFFVTSLEAIQRLSGNQDGFGGDLRYGEDTGLAGADKICTEIAEFSMPGSGVKDWRAFLSTTTVDAIDRIGEGPWYDRLGRVFALGKTDLLYVRPATANAEIANDLPNEYGVPNHDPEGAGNVDNHDFLTGSNTEGRLYKGTESTCNDWTSLDTKIRPRVGHTWPSPVIPGSGYMLPDAGAPPGSEQGDLAHWISALNENGCAPGINLSDSSVPDGSDGTVGGGGGYGGFYCFALQP
jgi:hypothetical protein